MSAALRRQGSALLGRLARLSSTSSAVQQLQQQPNVIAAEVAHLVSLRGGMTVLPPDVAAAIDEAAKGANRKVVKRRGQELSYRLRAMSRSKHRGGVHPNLAEQLEAAAGAAEGEEAVAARRQRRGKRRQSRNVALELLTKAPALPVRDASALPEADMAALLGQAGKLLSAEQAAQAAAEAEATAARSSIAEGGSLYDMPAALAYAATRLPACYAALRHVLGEVAARRPSWRPSSQLDFGAGPGTAVWAAQQAWPQAPLEATAVEPAGAMAWLGGEIQQRQRQQYEAALAAAAAAVEHRTQRRHERRQGPGGGAAVPETLQAMELESEREEDGEASALPAPPPRLRWMFKLPPRYRSQQGRQYDLVSAGYVLGELRSDSERRRLVEQLWEHTSGVLVLVEPGTPAGSSHIQRARTQLLELAARDAQQQQQQQRGQPQAGAVSGDGAAEAAGAHVVAPCPHDGPCPLQRRASWCHFVQRFQRTQLQRAAKATTGIQPRTYQDERFSYVAVARGPRPAAHTAEQQPAVAGSFFPSFDDPQDSLHIPANLAPRRVPANAMPLILYSDSEDDEEGQEDVDEWWGDAGGEEEEQEERVASGSDSDSLSDSDWESSSSDGSSSDSSSSESDSESESERGGEAAGGKGAASQLRQQSAAAAAAAATGRRGGLPAGAGLDGLDEATRRLLLQSVVDEEDEEGGSTELAAQLEAELAAAAQQAQQEATAAAQAVGAGPPGGRPGPWVLGPVSEATADLLYSGERVDWEAAEPAAVAAARAASGGWSRVIRTPRKRSGHVVLDLCSAAPPAEAHQQPCQGQGGGFLVRQVVSRAAARRGAGGTAAYRLARSLRWGDLWPLDYQARFRAAEPPAGQDLGQE